MALYPNLLRTSGGLVLPPEICLRVVEELLDLDPTSTSCLCLVSKYFQSLQKLHEKSITKSLARRNKAAYLSVNGEQGTIICSRTIYNEATLYTFPWFFEMKKRLETIDFLCQHQLTEMTDLNNSWPTLEIPKDQLIQRLSIFKKRAFLLLYKLADSTTGIGETSEIRALQAQFLEGLAEADLAALGVIVEVIGQGFFTMTKSAVESSDLLQNVVTSRPTSELYTPSSVPMADLHSDNWIRECMCVFEDLIQRYGPYFAFAYIRGADNETHRVDRWARQLLQEGLDNMNAFEMGYTMSYASLQSVVWKVLCWKINCSLSDSWVMAKEIVEHEMEGYKIGC